MPNAGRSLQLRRPIAAIFFASGAASLVFEVVWFHRCGLVFGNSLWSTTIVLSSFMGGLALGSAAVARLGHRVSGLLRAYALLELAVALSGIALTAALPAASAVLVPITRGVVDNPAVVNLVRLAAAFACLLVPATAMGATLPMLTAALCRTDARFGCMFGWLYGWNAAGAVAGVVGAEVFLIDYFGVMGSAWVAGATDVAIALAALRLSKGADNAAPERIPAERWRLSAAAWQLLLCGFLAGAILMAFEVVWFRFLSLFVIALTLPLALMLAVVLAGIAAGGLIMSSRLRGDPNAHAAALTALAAGCLAAAGYETFRFVAGHTQVSNAAVILGYAAWLTLPTATLSGALLTLLGDAIRREIADDAGTAGWLIVANTVGAMVGPLIATFVVLPALGMERSIFLLVSGYFIVSLVIFAATWGRARQRWASKLAGGSILAAAVFATFPFGLMARTYFPRATSVYTADGSTIAATREGTRDTLFLVRASLMGHPLYDRLATNNVSMSATTLVDKRYMRYFVFLPMLLRDAPLRQVLVACYGIGLTTGAATDLASAQSIDVVEISLDVIAMSDVVYAGAAHPLRDPRVRLHVEDARQFLMTTDRRFDLITGEPPPPPLPGTASLFSTEYFRLLRDHLTDDGVISYWLPVARAVGYDTAAVVRAFCDVFDDCSVWNGTPSNLILIGARRPIGPVPATHFARVWQDPVVFPRLREIGFEQPEQVGTTFIGDRSYLQELAGAAAPVTDNYPHRLLLDLRRYSLADPRTRDPHVLANYRAALDPERARRRFERSPLIRRVWPEPPLDRTLPFFEYQSIVNRVLQDGAKPLQHIEELDLLLRRTTLRRLPLWALGSNDTEQEIAQAGDNGSALFSYLIGVRTLAARSYPAAAAYFAEAGRRGFAAPALRPLMVYALCLSGSLEAARDQARDVRPVSSSEVHFWQWIGATFGVGPYADAAPYGAVPEGAGRPLPHRPPGRVEHSARTRNAAHPARAVLPSAPDSLPPRGCRHARACTRAVA